MGVKAEVEKSVVRDNGGGEVRLGAGVRDEGLGDTEEEEEREERSGRGRGRGEWVEMTIEIPGFRDDDALPVFLAAMLNEALLATGELPDRLWINNRWHWKLYIDVRLPPFPLTLRRRKTPSASFPPSHPHH